MSLSFVPETSWRCGKCAAALTPSKVDIHYLGNTFTVELLTCAVCGMVLIPEDLAVGKMFEVEQLLEDK